MAETRKKDNISNDYKFIKRQVNNHLESAIKKARIDSIVERASSLCDCINLSDTQDETYSYLT